jgi:hypothetical protein
MHRNLYGKRDIGQQRVPDGGIDRQQVVLPDRQLQQRDRSDWPMYGRRHSVLVHERRTVLGWPLRQLAWVLNGRLYWNGRGRGGRRRVQLWPVNLVAREVGRLTAPPFVQPERIHRDLPYPYSRTHVVYTAASWAL